ncbi:hypothetical protein TNCV_3189361 [Trichonephila clavipes]|nr:hypothetical protein TNCV_3189361 [Trichonephila clavipes]
MIRVRLVLQSACLVRWFLTENKKMNQQNINLKVCFKLGKTPTETYSMLVRAYKDHALSMKCVYDWFARFREGWKSVSDKTHSEKPATSVSDKNIEKNIGDQPHNFQPPSGDPLPSPNLDTIGRRSQDLVNKRFHSVSAPLHGWSSIVAGRDRNCASYECYLMVGVLRVLVLVPLKTCRVEKEIIR